MTQIKVDMQPIPAKQRELVQTLQELTDAMRQETGLRDARFNLNGGGKHEEITFIEEWDTSEQAQAHVQSEYFLVLRGAMKLLTTSSEVTVVTAQEYHERSVL